MILGTRNICLHSLLVILILEGQEYRYYTLILEGQEYRSYTLILEDQEYRYYTLNAYNIHFIVLLLNAVDNDSDSDFGSLCFLSLAL